MASLPFVGEVSVGGETLSRRHPPAQSPGGIIKKFVSATVLALLATLVAEAPATAGTASDAYVSVSAKDVTVPVEDCADSRYSITTSFPTARSWVVDLTLYDRSGDVAGGDYFTESDLETTGETTFCQGIDSPGTYEAVAEYTAYDDASTTVVSGTVRTTFRVTMRTPVRSTLSATRTPLGAKSWRIAGRLTKAGKPWGSRRVTIQARLYGEWLDILTKRTARDGRVVFTSTPTRANNAPLRLYSDGSSRVASAVSRTFKLPKR